MANLKSKLELTWIGKSNRPKLEPRILLENPERSYHAAHRVTDHDQFDNRLIFGDNLLALKALEQEFTGKIKCIFIDPPYNTGSAFTHYDDGIEHSLWLSLIRDRLDILRNLLRDDGSIWITLDDNESHYAKVLCDVLDSFLGSGTTAAVAHKMGRRWIGMKLGEHCHTHIIACRLKKVVDGADPGGITEAVGWKGGGGFRYYRLAPSLLDARQVGTVGHQQKSTMPPCWPRQSASWRVSPMPQATRSIGSTAIQHRARFPLHHHRQLSHDQLQQLSDEVGKDRSLLVVCSAFRGRKEGYSNLTVKKIPNAVLSRCEWGKDDYSLKVENLPKAPPAPPKKTSRPA
jgi:hypothetical protein